MADPTRMMPRMGKPRAIGRGRARPSARAMQRANPNASFNRGGTMTPVPKPKPKMAGGNVSPVPKPKFYSGTIMKAMPAPIPPMPGMPRTGPGRGHGPRARLVK